MMKFEWAKKPNGELSGVYEIPNGVLNFTILKGTTEFKVLMFGIPIQSYPEFKDVVIKDIDEGKKFCDDYLYKWFIRRTQPFSVNPIVLQSNIVDGIEFKHINTCMNFNIVYDKENEGYAINYLAIDPDNKCIKAETEILALYKVGLIELENRYFDFIKTFLRG